MKNRLASFINGKFSVLSKVQKTVIVALLCLLAAEIVVSFAVMMTRGRVRIEMEFAGAGAEGISSPVALNSAAADARLKKSGEIFYRFTESQRSLFAEVAERNSSAALVLRMEIPSAGTSFEFGFLDGRDFSDRGKFRFSGGERTAVSGTTVSDSSVFDVSFALGRTEKFSAGSVPSGFYVRSSSALSLISMCAAPAVLGFDRSSDIPFFGCPASGGTVDFSAFSADFSGAPSVFPVQNTVSAVMPDIQIKFSASRENSSAEKTVLTKISAGGELLSFRNTAGVDCITVPSAALSSPFSRISAEPSSVSVSAILMSGGDSRLAVPASGGAVVPVKADPGLILKWRQENWRTADYEIFEWDRFPGIIFFDTRNYQVQDRFFIRLAYFIEKDGFRGRLLTNSELAGRHGYNAHDYSAGSLALFFSAAEGQTFTLNPEEETLRKILLDNGIIVADGDGFREGYGGIVSISRSSEPWLRSRLLVHEGFHTLFFTDAEFRNFTAAAYYTMDQTSLSFLIRYFVSQPSLGYDINDTYLMHNEFMAYIMQQPSSEAASYFVHLAGRGSVMRAEPELSAYIRRTGGLAFEDVAVMFDDFAGGKWGLSCGNISLVTR